MNARETGPLPMAPLRNAPRANRSLNHRHDSTGGDPVDSALTAIGFAIDIRDVLRRLSDMLDGAP
jgi:hypothetical protein